LQLQLYQGSEAKAKASVAVIIL